MSSLAKILPRSINYTKILLGVWILLPILAGLKQYLGKSYNNYLIFKYVFVNTVNQNSLYKQQPEFYFDSNHYGPFFSAIFAPFALLPDAAGIFLWALFTSMALFFAINKLPLTQVQRNLILLICTHELYTSLVNLQSNPFIAALIILTFVCTLKNKEFWAGFFIAVGFLIKLYGIVGFAFILFAKNRFKFVGGFVSSVILLALVPAIFSSIDFQIASYEEWFFKLMSKNDLNLTSTMQNISAIGLFQKSISPAIPTRWILLGGLLLMSAMVAFNFKKFSSRRFQFLLLSAVLLFTILFSTGSESATYIIAFPGVAIWYITKNSKTKWDHFLLIFAIILTSFSPSDLFPADARTFVRQYSLKALPCFIIWLEIIRESFFLKPTTQEK